ncbi:MAG: DNA repair protein RecO [Eggerthellaceae bacterium]|nr:DNA repair protein RecO [Eggerthellaceae bacterium]
MAAGTYSSKVIVLRKTKLGESDLILNLLAEDGSALRAVAKGARKPSNAFAARLELYSVAEVLCSKGRSLDIVQEARLMQANGKLRSDLAYSAGAAPMAELLDKVVQAGLSNPRLFDMTVAAFSCLDSAALETVPALTAAHLLKALAFVGLRPMLTACAVCGSPIAREDAGFLRLSYSEGGVLCDVCASQTGSIAVPSQVCGWAEALLSSTFAQVCGYGLDVEGAFALLGLCKGYIHEHVGSSMKSLDFMLASGLYGPTR